MKRAYVAGPYRASTPAVILRNIAAAREVAETLWAMGYAVFCPHLNSACMDGVAPDEHFLAADLEFLRLCDFVALVPGWDRSEGARAEVREALAREIGVMAVDGSRCRWLTVAEVRAALEEADSGGAECDALRYVRDKARTTLNAAGRLPEYARCALLEIVAVAGNADKEG